MIVDWKHRVTLASKLRNSLGITAGSKLEIQQKGSEIIARLSKSVLTEKAKGIAD